MQKEQIAEVLARFSSLTALTTEEGLSSDGREVTLYRLSAWRMLPTHRV
ncbi:hypothetical protein [Brevibacillus fortis]